MQSGVSDILSYLGSSDDYGVYPRHLPRTFPLGWEASMRSFARPERASARRGRGNFREKIIRDTSA